MATTISKTDRLQTMGIKTNGNTYEEVLEPILSGMVINVEQTMRVLVSGYEFLPLKYTVTITDSKLFIKQYDHLLFELFSKYQTLNLSDNHYLWLQKIISFMLSDQLAKSITLVGVSLTANADENKSQTVIKLDDFHLKYQYIEEIENVSQAFEITEINNPDNPAGVLIDTEYGASQSRYRLIERANQKVLVDTTEASDVMSYIRDELKLNIEQ